MKFPHFFIERPIFAIVLAILIVVFDAAGVGATDAKALLAHRVAAAFTAGTLMLALALALVLVLIVRPHKALVSSETAR